MLSSVFVSGRLGKRLTPEIRLVEVDSVLPGPGGRFKVDSFPVLCPLSPSSLFFSAKDGSLIVIKGRLENDKAMGLVIVDEIDEIFPCGEKKE